MSAGHGIREGDARRAHPGGRGDDRERLVDPDIPAGEQVTLTTATEGCRGRRGRGDIADVGEVVAPVDRQREPTRREVEDHRRDRPVRRVARADQPGRLDDDDIEVVGGVKDELGGRGLGLGVPAVDQRRVEGRHLGVHLTGREVGLRVDRADVDQSRDRRLLAGGHDMTRPADVDRLELGGDPGLDGDQRGEVEDRRRCRVQAVEQAAGRPRVADVTALGLDIEPAEHLFAAVAVGEGADLDAPSDQLGTQVPTEIAGSAGDDRRPIHVAQPRRRAGDVVDVQTNWSY